MELEMTLTDPKTFTKPISLRMENVLQPDTVLLEDVCENERDSSHLDRGVRLAPEILSKYAGSYEFAPGRAVVVTISGDLLFAQEGATAAKLAFVPRSDTSFLASVTDDAIEFVKDSRGAVTHLIWRGRGKDEKAVRTGNPAQDQKK
jgi:hypothetical protein